MSAGTLAEFFLAAWAAMAAGMALAFGLRRATGNSGWIDATWTFSVGVAGAALAFWADAAGPRGLVVGAAALLWAGRLGTHIVRRTLMAGDDPRYRALEAEWGANAAVRLFLFLQAQAFVGALLALAIALAASARPYAPRDALAGALFAAALVGEAVADRQLERFKADPRNRGGICDAGLWSRSRHPNYFFEWLTWAAAALAALDVLGGGSWSLTALIAPAVMFWTLRFASGVPPVEQRMRATRGEAFARYSAKTPVFFPRLF